MSRKLLAGLLLFALVVVGVGCAQPPDSQEESGGQEPEQVVLGPQDAFDVAIGSLQRLYPDRAPASGTAWTAEEVPVTGPGGEPLVGASKMRIYSDDWEGMVHWAVVAPQYLEYVIVLRSPTLGWHWQGSVSGVGGEVSEEVPMVEMDESASTTVARDFVTQSPTFVFDGIPETLELVETTRGECPYCWVFTIGFDSAHAGYGDRTDQMLAQVITPHTAVVTVEAGVVTSAILDEAWDMLQQRML